jgi:hypothetical protein
MEKLFQCQLEQPKPDRKHAEKIFNNIPFLIPSLRTNNQIKTRQSGRMKHFKYRAFRAYAN